MSTPHGKARGLEKLGRDSKPLLRDALKARPNLEARRRIEALLQKLRGFDTGDLTAYFKKLKDGGSPREAYQAGFGEASIDDLQKEWLEYVKKMEPVKK